MKKVEIYTKNYCPFCRNAKQLLTSKGIEFEEIDVTFDPELQQEMMERSKRRTVPQIFIDNDHIGGCRELYALENAGHLDKLLAA